MKAKKGFEIKELNINKADLKCNLFFSGKDVPVNIKIDALNSVPLRSRWAIFDLFFRTNATGFIDENKIDIKTRQIMNGRETTWITDNLSVSKTANLFLPQYLFFQNGTVDINISDKWSLGDNPEIEMNWSLILKDFLLSISEDTPKVKGMIYKRIADYLNKYSKEIPIKFKVYISKDKFESIGSLEAVGLWKLVEESFISSVAKNSGIKEEKVKEITKEEFNKFKSFLKNRKAKKSEI